MRDARDNALLGECNCGGTLDKTGMRFANRATWVHVLQAAAQLLERPLGDLLSGAEVAAVQGSGAPRWLR